MDACTAICIDHKIESVDIMLYTIAVVMLILWLLGMITSYTLGGFIHILLVIAIVVVLLRVINR
ncbi:MAG: lmo0937 family membrane protein [Sulfuricella sp.]